MKTRSKNHRDSRERRPETALSAAQSRGAAAPARKPSRESFPPRTRKPGEVGLANEARPGLGTRGQPPAAGKSPPRAPGASGTNRIRSDREPLGRDAPLPPAKPRPKRREQAPDSLAHELERATGVSGQTSGG